MARQFSFAKLNARQKAHHRGTLSKTILETMPDDPIIAEEMELLKQKERRKAEHAIPFNAKLNALGIDKATFKKLNREFKALRLAGKTLLSYNDWMQEQQTQAE